LTVGTFKLIKVSTFGGQVLDNSSPERVIVGFGTGQQIPQSLNNAAQYASGQQYLFGIWDWNFSGWNNTLKALPQAVVATGSVAPSSITLSLLKQQSITTVTPAAPALAYRTVSNNYFCYAAVGPADTNSCSTPGIYFGWYIPLPATMEQTVFNPILSPDGEFVVNTFIPAQDSPLSCNTASASTGFTMGVTADTGGGQSSGTTANPTGYFKVSTTSGMVGADGVQLNGTGIPMFLSSGQKADNNTEYLITQTSGGAATPVGTNRHVIVTGKRANWVQRR
jgi:type IV pilus assembly protein PilY1